MNMKCVVILAVIILNGCTLPFSRVWTDEEAMVRYFNYQWFEYIKSKPGDYSKVTGEEAIALMDKEGLLFSTRYNRMFIQDGKPVDLWRNEFVFKPNSIPVFDATGRTGRTYFYSKGPNGIDEFGKGDDRH